MQLEAAWYRLEKQRGIDSQFLCWYLKHKPKSRLDLSCGCTCWQVQPFLETPACLINIHHSGLHISRSQSEKAALGCCKDHAAESVYICIRHRSLRNQRSLGSKASIRSTKVCTKTVFPGEAARSCGLKCSPRLLSKDTMIPSICMVVKISVAVGGCWHVFKTVLALFSRGVVWSKRRWAAASDVGWRSRFLKRDSSSTVVDLNGHFTKQRYVAKYPQPLHISTQSRTLFAPFDAVWSHQRFESTESFKKAPL